MKRKMKRVSQDFIDDDKLHEECGVFGIFDRNCSALEETFYGIFFSPASRAGKCRYHGK